MTENSFLSSKAHRVPRPLRTHQRATAILLVFVLLASACGVGRGTVELVASDLPPTPVPETEPEQPTPEPIQPTPEPIQPTPEPIQPTPVPVEPVIEKVHLRPIGGGMDGWHGVSQADALGRISNSGWHWQDTWYKASTEVPLLGVNEDISAWAGGRRRFTPPQPDGLFLHLDLTLKGALWMSIAVNTHVEVSVVARIQTTPANGTPRVLKVINVHNTAIGEKITESVAGWSFIDERIQIDEALPPLPMGEQYHMELELRCRSQVLGTFAGGGICAFGLEELNEDLNLPTGNGMYLHDAYLSYVVD